MSALRNDAMALLERMPEDKLRFIIQIMQGIEGLYSDTTDKKSTVSAKEQAFERLEQIRRSVPDLDYDKELREYREGKYQHADLD